MMNTNGFHVYKGPGQPPQIEPGVTICLGPDEELYFVPWPNQEWWRCEYCGSPQLTISMKANCTQCGAPR